MYDVIAKKRDGHALSTDEIYFFIEGYTSGHIPDYQASALLMAIYFQGMSLEESAILTRAMVDSGETVDLSHIAQVKVDKHSTGGVGDSTTISLSALVASVGVTVPKMSGRGLGFTGGTIDKLESIEGFQVEISNDKFVQLVNEYGVAVVGQSTNLAPADKLLYSLRDVTATEVSIPLIASSIMSKKIASGTDKILLDVKVGSGTFMKTFKEAKLLAETMVSIGNANGKETVAVLTNMDQPLGYAIGNALEIAETVDVLQGVGPIDLTELCLTLGTHMVVLAGRASSFTEARLLLEESMKNGKAIAHFKKFIEGQGGNSAFIHHSDLLPKAKYQVEVRSEMSGYISKMEAEAFGKASVQLGAGRKTMDDEIDLAVGIILHKKIGDYVKVGEPLMTIHTNEMSHGQQVGEQLLQYISFSDNRVDYPLILDVID